MVAPLHHGNGDDGNCSEAELCESAERIRACQQQGATVWASFNNDWKGYALNNARALRDLIQSSCNC
jgi:uncharacterized protein YecE (DUF72 family)